MARALSVLLAIAVLFASLPWDLVLATNGLGHEEVSASGQASPSSPAPTSPTPEDPCSDGCLCACCPAHAALPPSFPLTMPLPRPSALRPALPLSSRVHPSEFTDRVFHPPRLG
jgi:hypothetical protein